MELHYIASSVHHFSSFCSQSKAVSEPAKLCVRSSAITGAVSAWPAQARFAQPLLKRYSSLRENLLYVRQEAFVTAPLLSQAHESCMTCCKEVKDGFRDWWVFSLCQDARRHAAGQRLGVLRRRVVLSSHLIRIELLAFVCTD